MKAFLFSIGEKTTDICKEQLERYSFNVILLDQRESIYDKYIRFINMADEDCLKIDADIIPNKNIANIVSASETVYNESLMVQFSHYDFYKNSIGVGNPVLYKAVGLSVIKENLDKICKIRPETSAWRLEDIKMKAFTSSTLMGMHGFFQHEEDIKRVKQQKIDRKQIEQFDFDLVNKLYGL